MQPPSNTITPTRRRGPGSRSTTNLQAQSLQRFYFCPKDLENDVNWASVSSEARGVIITLMFTAWSLIELPVGLPELARVTPCTVDELERTREQWQPWFKKAPRRDVMTCPWIELRRKEALERYEKHTSAQAASTKARREKAFSALRRNHDASMAQGLSDGILISNKEERSPPDGGPPEEAPSDGSGTRDRWVALCHQTRGGNLRTWWSFVGKMAKDFGDSEVTQVLCYCLELADLPADPRAWVLDQLRRLKKYHEPGTFPEHPCWRMEYAGQGCRGCCEKANAEARVDRKSLPYPDLR